MRALFRPKAQRTRYEQVALEVCIPTVGEWSSITQAVYASIPFVLGMPAFASADIAVRNATPVALFSVSIP